MKVYVGATEKDAKVVYELGNRGLLRWTDVHGAFHIAAVGDGDIGVYVPNSIRPRGAYDATVISPICPACRQVIKEVE